MKNLRKLTRFLARNRQRLSPLLILTHDYPDPDAMASAWALQHLAQERFGIRSKIAYGGVIGRHENKEMMRALRPPASRLRSSDLVFYPNVALVDTQPTFDNNSFPKNRRAAIVIDQHPSSSRPLADLVIVDTDAGATSVLLAQELLAQDLDIPPRLATALVYGILSDTLHLYHVTKPHIVKTYLALLPLCDIRALARIQNPPRSKKFFRGLAAGLRNAIIGREIIISHLGAVENPDLVAQMADFLLTCQGVQWSFCTGRYGDFLHVSLRTTSSRASAGDVLRQIFDHFDQAGGHGRIAGGKVKVGRLTDQVEWQGTEFLLTERLTKRLRGIRFQKFQPLIKESLRAPD
ncbi:MAG: phosphoesterase [Ignavibacteria bacterium]|nr:phosphoesterase [Ignavibacteria bacterium]